MAWFVAHESFTALHHIRAHAEALLAGAHGPLPLAAIAPLSAILEAACRLEACLRTLAAIDRLRSRPAAAAGLRPIPLAAIVQRAGLAHAAASLPILARSPEMAGDALAALLAGQDPRPQVRIFVRQRHIVLEIRHEAAASKAPAERGIDNGVALLQLAAAGARLRRMHGRVLALWRRAENGGCDITPEAGSGAADRDRT